MINIDNLQTILPIFIFVIFFGLFFLALKLLRKIQTKKILHRRLSHSVKAPTDNFVKNSYFEKIRYVGYSLITLFAKLLDYLNLLSTKNTRKVPALLASAGLRSKSAVATFISVSYLLPLLLLVFTVILVFSPLLNHALGLHLKIFFSLIAFLVGARLPYLYLDQAKKSYQKKFSKDLPDAIDLMVICFEAGYGIDSILKRLADEFRNYNPVLSQEFELTVTELKLLASRRQAWQDFAERMPLQEVRDLVAIIQQNEKYGIPIAKTLRGYSVTMQKDKLLKAEQKAARLPTLLIFPLFVFFFPVMFALIITPIVMVVSRVNL